VKKNLTAKQQAEMAAKIIKKAVQVTEKTPHDVFVEYAAHVKAIFVNIHRGGWNKNKNSYRLEAWFTLGDIDAEFDVIIRELENLAKDSTK
jgi:hypothetical protein